MGNILIRNVPDDVKAALKRRASARGISMEAEVRGILSSSALGSPSASPTRESGLGTLSRALFGTIGFSDREFQSIDFSIRPVDFGGDDAV